MLHNRAFVPAVVFLVIWGLTTHGKYSVTGDEPHYLMVAHSLWSDGDYDLRNNHAQDDGQWFGAAGLDPGQHVRETRHGALYPVHDVGLPTLLAPVYGGAKAIATLPPEGLLARFRMDRGLFAYSLISLLFIAISAWAARMTLDALLAGGVGVSVGTATVLALWLSPPLLSASFLVFPEVLVLLVSAWGLRLAAQADSGRRDTAQLVAFLIVAAAMPWLHRKFVVYALLLMVAVLWLCGDTLRTSTRSTRVALACGLAMPSALLALWTLYHWGNLGGALMLDRVPLSWDALQRGVAGLLIDRENGLFVWTPIYLLAPVAWWLAAPRDRIWLLPVTGLFLLSAAHDQWWGGFSPAARFLVPAVPLVAMTASAALNHRAFRLIAIVLLVPTIAIAAYGWQNPRALWPQGDGENRVLRTLVGDSQGILPRLRPEVE